MENDILTALFYLLDSYTECINKLVYFILRIYNPSLYPI